MEKRLDRNKDGWNRRGGKTRKQLTERIKRLQGKNYSDQEICDALDIRPQVLRSIKTDNLIVDRQVFETLDNAIVYSDYMLKSKQMVKRLHELQMKLKLQKGGGAGSAFVAAVKLEKEIYDTCIKHGQDFGFIEKKASTMEVSGEFQFSTMSTEEMQTEIAKQMKELNQLAQGKTIEMRPELLNAIGGDVGQYLPTNVIDMPRQPDSHKKVKVKTKVTLRRNV